MWLSGLAGVEDHELADVMAGKSREIEKTAQGKRLADSGNVVTVRPHIALIAVAKNTP